MRKVNIRFAVVVQDLVSEWIQSYPCENKNFARDGKVLTEIFRAIRKVEGHFHNSLEFAKSCEDVSWNHRTSSTHRSETNGITERAVRRVKEGTSKGSIIPSGAMVEYHPISVRDQTRLHRLIRKFLRFSLNRIANDIRPSDSKFD